MKIMSGASESARGNEQATPHVDAGGAAAEKGRRLKDPAGANRLFRIISPAYPTFNIYSHVADVTTSLGPVCIATAVNQLSGWDAEMIDENNYRRYGPRNHDGIPDHETLQRMRHADVVGLYGGLTSTIPRLYEIARFYREAGVTTIAGGQHFAGENIAEALQNGIDIVMIGEGEDAIQEILVALAGGGDKKGIPGIAYLEDGKMVRTGERMRIADFERLPLPDFSLVRYARIGIYPINWVRGCGMNCEFCTVKGKPRPASPERVFRHITNLVETRDARRFFIVDDLFGQFRKEALRLCKLLADYQDAIGVRIELTVQIRLDKARDSELLLAMRRAGVATVAIGFESPIEDELRAMEKNLKPEEMIEQSLIYHRSGFHVHGMFIFGYPLPENAAFQMPMHQRVRHFRRFIRRAGIDTVQVLLPIPLPGTELRERLTKQGRVFSHEVIGWEYYDGNFPIFNPDPPATAEEMQKAARRIMGRFYRFNYMFAVGFNVLSFPYMVFYLHNIRKGWRMWYTHFRHNVIRFGGWLTLRKWLNEYKKGNFPDKLDKAQKELARTGT